MKKIGIALAFLVGFTWPSLASEKLALGTGDSLPFAGVGAEGDPVGILGDTSNRILEDMGYDASATRLPFARLYQSIHKGEIDVAIGVLRTDERASQARYSDPILTAYNVLVVKKGEAFDFSSLSDLRGKKIGGRRGFAYPSLEAQGVSVEPAKDDETNLKLGNRVRDLGLDTHLTADSEVHSGGTDLFLAGVERSMEEGAIIGVHSWAEGNRAGADFPKDDPVHESYVSYTARMLGSADFYWFTLDAAPVEDTYIMTPADIAKYGLLTKPVVKN